MNGADPWKKSKYKETCFDYAEKRGFRRLAEEFRIKITREEMKRSIARHVSVHQGAIVQVIADCGESSENKAEREGPTPHKSVLAVLGEAGHLQEAAVRTTLAMCTFNLVSNFH
eukprot:gene24374-29468_t